MECALAESSLLTYLPVASFALAAAGLGVRVFVPTGPARQTLLAAVLVFLVLASGLIWRQEQNCKEQIGELATDIIRLLGNEKRTYEQIVAGLRNQTYYKTNAALDLLLREKRIGTESPTIVDQDSRKNYQITLFYVRTF
jgi:hypothetical protein